jgi:hypothetical protein
MKKTILATTILDLKSRPYSFFKKESLGSKKE